MVEIRAVYFIWQDGSKCNKRLGHGPDRTVSRSLLAKSFIRDADASKSFDHIRQNSNIRCFHRYMCIRLETLQR